MKEQVVVNLIESQLKSAGRMYFNLHGSVYSNNGSPDFLTMDADGKFMGIEAKAPNKTPYTNQWRRAIEILLSGGRFFVGQHDFDIDKADKGQFPMISIGREIGQSEFLMADEKISGTTEVKLTEKGRE